MMTGLRSPSVRAAVLWLLAALLILVLAACTQAASADIPTASGNQGTAPVDTNPAPTPVNEADAALVYAQCIRANGYPEWPDPEPDGRIMLRRDSGSGMSMNDPRRRAAMEACQDLRPAGAGGGGGAMMGAGGMAGGGFADEEQAFAFARCMRENGVPDFPDPNPGGGPMIFSEEGSGGELNPNDPRFQAAVQTCRASVLEAGQ